MTKKILLFLTLGCLMAGMSHAQTVEWKTIEQAAKTDTKSNAKLYFVDFYTSWCGWCKKMDKETFSNPTVALILNTYYIPVKFDAEGSTEFTWNGTKYNNTAVAPGAKRTTHNFAKKVLGAQNGLPLLRHLQLQPTATHRHSRLPKHPTISSSCFGILPPATTNATPSTNTKRFSTRKSVPL